MMEEKVAATRAHKPQKFFLFELEHLVSKTALCQLNKDRDAVYEAIKSLGLLDTQGLILLKALGHSPVTLQEAMERKSHE